jgi:hypothetical protein
LDINQTLLLFLNTILLRSYPRSISAISITLLKAPVPIHPHTNKVSHKRNISTRNLYYKLHKSTAKTTTASSNPIIMQKPDGFQSDIFALGLLHNPLLHSPSKIFPIVYLTTRNPIGANAQAKEIKRLIMGGTCQILDGCDQRLSEELRDLLSARIRDVTYDGHPQFQYLVG